MHHRGKGNTVNFNNSELFVAFDLLSHNNPLQVGEEAAGKQQMLSSSDHSDIVTLGDEHAEVEVGAATHEELYLGTSCSSHYAFTAAETGRTTSTCYRYTVSP